MFEPFAMQRFILCRSTSTLLASLLFPFMVFSSQCSPMSHNPTPTDRTVEIRGVVKDCWQKQVIPVRNLPIYIYEYEENVPISKKLQEIRQLPPEPTVENIEHFFRLYEELTRLVEAAHPATRHTRTNEQGEFLFHGLESNQRYLILAIGLETEDRGAYYKSLITEKLKPGTHEVKFWMGVGSESECGQPDH